MLKQTSQALLAALQENKVAIGKGRSALYPIINTLLIPHVDQENMAQRVVGRAYWMAANSNDRQLFMQEFTKVVVRTYATALISYSDEKMKFSPLRAAVGDKTQLEVNSQISQGNGSSIALTYRLILKGQEWKLFDFSVDGVSLVQNYQSQFADVLAKKGFSGLLSQLLRHNKEGG